MVGDVCFQETLIEAATEVFETMMFMALEPVEDGAETLDSETLLSSITFNGDVKGCLGICLSKHDAKMIAANMLCMEPDDDISIEEICDAMGEVANMVLGSIKKRIIDEVGDFNVSIPCTVEGKMLEYSLGNNATQVRKLVNIDGCLVEFELLYKFIEK